VLAKPSPTKPKEISNKELLLDLSTKSWKPELKYILLIISNTEICIKCSFVAYQAIQLDLDQREILVRVTQRLLNLILPAINITKTTLLKKKERCKSSMEKFKLVKVLKLSPKPVARKVCLLDLPKEEFHQVWMT
jgi:hypothetical protein